MTDTLPLGWDNASIEELCMINPKHSKDTDMETDVSFVPMPAVCEKNGSIKEHESRKLGEVWKGYTHFAENDVIFAKITPCMENGKAAVAKGLTNGMACGSTEFYVMRTNGAILPNYLHQYVRQQGFRDDAERNMSGAVGQRRVPKTYLQSQKLPVPPLNEQHRIVEKVDALMARSGAAKEALDAIPTLLDQYRQSVLAAAFRGDLTKDWRENNPDIESADTLLERIRKERRQRWEETELAKFHAKGKEPKNDKWKEKYKEPIQSDLDQDLPKLWTSITSDECFYFVTSGSRGWAKYYSDEGAQFLRVGNLDRLTISLDLSDIQHVHPPIGAEGSRTKVQCADVLISITADIGMIARIDETIGEAYVNQHVALARPVLDGTSKYVAWYMASHEGQKQLGTLQRGATKAGLGLDDIRSVNIPLPPLAEQKKIIEAIEQAFSFISNIDGVQRECSARLPRLNQSILAKAFKGELVPQDPDDEPASVLLERIRTERTAQAPVKKRGQKKVV
jgi:type I restriction enzyme S subunit